MDNSIMGDEARFRITGAVIRKWVAPSGKFATASIEVGGPRVRKIKVRAFRDMVAEFDSLGVGEIVTLTGELEVNALTDKAKQEVKVDGYNVFSNELTVTAIKRSDATRTVEPPKKKEPAKETPPDDDSIPFD